MSRKYFAIKIGTSGAAKGFIDERALKTAPRNIDRGKNMRYHTGGIYQRYIDVE